MSCINMITSKKKASAITSALFLLGLAALLFTRAWWPGILLVVGVPLAIRQYLTGRTYDMLLTLLVFAGTFVTVLFDFAWWEAFLATLFAIGAIFILYREFFGPDETTVAEEEEEINHEIEEEKK